MRKLILTKPILSIFVLVLFLSNIIFFNIGQCSSFYSDKISVSVVEQFYTETNLPTKVISSILFNSDPHKTTKKSNDKKNMKKYNDEFVLCSQTNFNSFNITRNLFSFVNSFVSNSYYEYKIVNYPLKIPFCCICIFLLLLIKLLFNILPRSISINYNKKNIGSACIV